MFIFAAKEEKETPTRKELFTFISLKLTLKVLLHLFWLVTLRLNQWVDDPVVG